MSTTWHRSLALLLVTLLLAPWAPVVAADPLDDLLPFAIACPPPCPGLDTLLRLVAPGGTISFQPGLYEVNAPLVLSKPVSLIGPQAGVDPRPSAGSDRVAGDMAREAILDGRGVVSSIFVIQSDGVLIDGLELRAAKNDVVIAPQQAPGESWSGLVVANNMVHGGENLLDVRSGDAPHVHHNRFFDAFKTGPGTSNGVIFGWNTTDAVFESNDVNNVYGEFAGIYFFGTNRSTIRANVVTNVATDDGIKLGHRGGDDAAFFGGTIADNVVAGTSQDGITVYMSNVTVVGNDVSASRSANGAIFVQFAVRNVVVANNTVHDNPALRSSSGSAGIKIGSLVSSTVVGTLTVRGNSITNNAFTGIRHSGGGTLIAENNWWGDSTGPKHSTLNPGGLGQVQTGSNVDFNPWCVSAAC